MNCDAVGSFVFFITCLVAGFHEISNRFSKFLWDGSELIEIVRILAFPQFL